MKIYNNDENFNIHNEYNKNENNRNSPFNFNFKTLKQKKNFSRFGAFFLLILLSTFSYTLGKYSLLDKKNVKIEALGGQNQNCSSSSSICSCSQNSLSTVEVAKKVGPCVVGITTKHIKDMGIWGKAESEGLGSGIIMSKDGYIVTNNHVVEKSDAISVILNTGGKEYPAKIVGRDEKTDLAVIKITPDCELKTAEFGNSATIEVGELAIAIGNPLGLELTGTVTSGIVSAVNRELRIGERTFQLIQTDAAINGGNSGGPLINQKGEVIGINTVKISRANEVEGIGFAIPINTVKAVVADLIEHGYVKGRPVLGIMVRNINDAIAKQQNWPVGIQVMDVVAGSAAENASIKRGDIITKCNNENVTTSDELNNIKDKMTPGDKITLTVYKYETSKFETVTVKLMEEKNVVGKK